MNKPTMEGMNKKTTEGMNSVNEFETSTFKREREPYSPKGARYRMWFVV